MKIEIRHVGDVAIVTPIGTLYGADETDDLDMELQALAKQGNRSLLVDLGSARIIGDRPLGILVRWWANYRERGGKILLCRVSQQDRRVFDITKLSQVFEICRTEGEALLSFTRGPVPGGPSPGKGRVG